MPELEMLVSLLIPDNTALTAANVLRKMGHHNLLNLKREAYYKFNFDGDIKSFAAKIAKADILVNFNKHKAQFHKPGEQFGDSKTRILVKDIDNANADLLQTLRIRLGFKNLRRLEIGTMWVFAIDDKPENLTAVAWSIARKLLYNKHYQTAEIISKA